jgi:hypothetical protein
MTHYPLYDLAVVVGFAALFFVPVAFEIRRRRNAPKPTGATKI